MPCGKETNLNRQTFSSFHFSVSTLWLSFLSDFLFPSLPFPYRSWHGLTVHLSTLVPLSRSATNRVADRVWVRPEPRDTTQVDNHHSFPRRLGTQSVSIARIQNQYCTEVLHTTTASHNSTAPQTGLACLIGQRCDAVQSCSHTSRVLGLSSQLHICSHLLETRWIFLSIITGLLPGRPTEKLVCGWPWYVRAISLCDPSSLEAAACLAKAGDTTHRVSIGVPSGLPSTLRRTFLPLRLANRGGEYLSSILPSSQEGFYFSRESNIHLGICNPSGIISAFQIWLGCIWIRCLWG